MRRLAPLLLLPLLGACDRAPPPVPPAQPRRVVSLLPSFTEIVVKLGAADRLVGCTEYGEPGRDLPRVSWQGPGAAEAILRLQPDLVLRQMPRTATDPLRDTLERAGIAVLALPSERIDDVRAAIVELGRALGRVSEAAAFRQAFEDDLARARAGADGRPTPSVLFVLRRDTGRVANITAAGPGTFLDELIRYAGGRNVLADLDQPYPSVRLETVLRLQPEVVIDNLPREDDPLAVWAPLASLPAVAAGRVRVVADNGLLIPGPRLPAAVARMVELIHGGA